MKSNQVTVQQRVEEIASLKLLGALWTDIRQHAEEKEWGVSERQLHRYLASADEVIAANVEKNRDRLLAHHFSARRALYARAMAVSDYKTALAVLKDEAELLALYPAKRHEVTGADGGPMLTAVVEMQDDERAAALAALHARVGTGNRGQIAERTADPLGPPLGEARNPDGIFGDAAGCLADDVAPLGG
jgi:hypothetical protein